MYLYKHVNERFCFLFHIKLLRSDVCLLQSQHLSVWISHIAGAQLPWWWEAPVGVQVLWKVVGRRVRSGEWSQHLLRTSCVPSPWGVHVHLLDPYSALQGRGSFPFCRLGDWYPGWNSVSAPNSYVTPGPCFLLFNQTNLVRNDQ